jgi:hypothetical protein
MKPRAPLLLSLIVVLVGISWLPVVAHVNPAAPPARSVSTTLVSIPPGEPGRVADTDRVSVAYTFPDPVVEHAGEFDRVAIPGLSTHGEPGTPVLPVKTAKILLPPGAELESVEVIAGGESVLGDGYRIEPGQELIPLGSSPTDTPTPQDPAIYGSAARFPGELHTLLSVQRLTGYTILLLSLHPVQYTPTTGELTFNQSLTVDVEITPPVTTRGGFSKCAQGRFRGCRAGAGDGR